MVIHARKPATLEKRSAIPRKRSAPGGARALTAVRVITASMIAAGAAMANRKSAGEAARNAARRSTDNFRRLHELGCMWLVYE